MLKRKNQDTTNPGGQPPAKRQALCDLTNNSGGQISDPKCTIVPISPVKIKPALATSGVVAEFKVPEIKIYVMVSSKKPDLFSPMVLSPDSEREEGRSCDVTRVSFMSVEEQSNVDKRLDQKKAGFVCPNGESSPEATPSLSEEKSSSDGEICEIDAEEKTNPHYAWEYAGNIHLYMLRQEVRHRPTPYLTRHQQLTLSMRHILVDWIVEVQEGFELYHETLYLAVRLIDRYLAKSRDMNMGKLQLLGACCVLIASKFEEVSAPSLDDFVHICADAYEREEFREMEKQICVQLDYDINTPVLYRFLRRYFKASKQSMELHTLARYISELTLLDYSMALELPSKVAMACLYIALRMSQLQWGKELEMVTGAKEAAILPLAERVNAILNRAFHTEHSFNVKSKYAHEVFYKVATKRPLTYLAPRVASKETSNALPSCST